VFSSACFSSRRAHSVPWSLRDDHPPSKTPESPFPSQIVPLKQCHTGEGAITQTKPSRKWRFLPLSEQPPPDPVRSARSALPDILSPSTPLSFGLDRAVWQGVLAPAKSGQTSQSARQ